MIVMLWIVSEKDLCLCAVYRGRPVIAAVAATVTVPGLIEGKADEAAACCWATTALRTLPRLIVLESKRRGVLRVKSMLLKAHKRLFLYVVVVVLCTLTKKNHERKALLHTHTQNAKSNTEDVKKVWAMERKGEKRKRKRSKEDHKDECICDGNPAGEGTTKRQTTRHR